MDSVSETKTQAPTAISCGAVARDGRPHLNGLYVSRVQHQTRDWFNVLNSDGYPVAIAGDARQAEDYKTALEHKRSAATTLPTTNKPTEVDIFS